MTNDDHSRTTRRRFLELGAGAANVALAGCFGGDESSPPTGETTNLPNLDEDDDRWHVADSPTQMTLYDAVRTRAGPYAVGEGGRVLGRLDGEWQVELESGPRGEHNGLHGADATANGRHLWFCGDSGVVGRYAVGDGELTDFSAPKGKTSTWEDLAVAGLAGQEWLYLVNGSGELLRGKHDGDDVTWESVVKPGSGSSAAAVAFVNRGTGYVCDTSGNVFQTIDAGSEWRRIGIDHAGANFHDVAAQGADDVSVAADSGGMFQYNGFTWTRLSAGENAIRTVERNKHIGLAADSTGVVYELSRGGWQAVGVGDGNGLHGVVLGTTDVPDVAVGASGTILEHPR
ncbi:NHL repeat-containing protein [Halorussus halophilus]|uniref:hypothetical protein n=1 Tax=Halorussus halophilus TaxID=2650975 RepID=UPI00130172A6|nr:hypothetical protein [Halorussus halophilus]